MSRYEVKEDGIYMRDVIRLADYSTIFKFIPYERRIISTEDLKGLEKAGIIKIICDKIIEEK